MFGISFLLGTGKIERSVETPVFFAGLPIALEGLRAPFFILYTLIPNTKVNMCRPVE